MDFFELVKMRESCRSYRPVPVEREKLEKCALSAIKGPSACNSQPWSFIIVDDEDTARKVSETLQDKVMPINRFTRNCKSFIVITEEPANISSKLGGKFKDQDFAQMDIGIAAMSISLAATFQGLGSCIIGWFNENRLSAILGIPASKRIRLVISVGYRDNEDVREKKRKPPEEVLHYNKW